MSPGRSAPAPHDPGSGGLAAAFAAYLIWGLSPIYFKALAGVPAPEILAHRVLWSVAVLAVAITALRRWPAVRAAIASRRSLGVLAATTVLISANWLLYIWAVNGGRVLEASLGYFVNPLVNVALGALFLGEALSRRQRVAVAIAAAGVAVLVLRLGTVPWVSLTLAGTFGLYGLLRKVAGIDALGGLLVETALLAPLALLFLQARHAAGAGAFGSTAHASLLLAAAGPITAVPLVLFAVGVRRLRLSTVGLVQFVAPTVQFLLAVVRFGEPFTRAHAIAFGLIWTALLLYVVDAMTAGQRN